MSYRKCRGVGVISVVVFGALLWGWVGPATAAEPAGRLVSASGPVEIRQLGQRAWHVATIQSILQPGDVLRTGPGGAAEVALVDGVFRLDENTVVVLPAPDSVSVAGDAPQGVRVFLYGGRALFKVFKDRLQRGFEILTPSVIVGVKGTTFGVEQGPNLGVLVFEGTVAVTQRGRPDLPPVMVGAGQFTELFRGQLTPSRPFDPARPAPVWRGAPTSVQSGPLPLPSPPGPGATGSGGEAKKTSAESTLSASPTPSTPTGDGVTALHREGSPTASGELSAAAGADSNPAVAPDGLASDSRSGRGHRHGRSDHPLSAPPGLAVGAALGIGGVGGGIQGQGPGGGASSGGFLPPGLGPLDPQGQIGKHKK